MMKILNVIAGIDPRYGGSSKAVLDISAALVRIGHQAVIYTTNRTIEGRLNAPAEHPTLIKGIPVYHFPIKTRGRQDLAHPPRDAFLGRHWAYSKPLGAALRCNISQFDLVHIHGLYEYPTLKAAAESRRQGIPYVISPHGALDPFLRRKRRIRKTVYMALFERRNLNSASAIFYTTREEHDLVHPQLKLRSVGMVVQLILDLEEYSQMPPRGAFRSRHPEIGNRFIILFMSRINFKKGLDLLAQAFSEVISQRPNAHLVIAGPDNEGYGQQVREWLSALKVLDRVTFTGMVSGDEKLGVYRDADLFVLPSYSENFGIVLVEAMSCGLPVITTNKVNIYPKILEYNAGFIIDCDYRQLAQSIIKLMDYPELRQMFARNGQELVKIELNTQKCAHQLTSVYRTILDKQ